jgi:hypothetical protein
MLGAVKAERASAQEPEDEADGQGDHSREADLLGEQEEAEGCDQRKGEESPLARPRDAAAAEDR